MQHTEAVHVMSCTHHAAHATPCHAVPGCSCIGAFARPCPWLMSHLSFPKLLNLLSHYQIGGLAMTIWGIIHGACHDCLGIIYGACVRPSAEAAAVWVDLRCLRQCGPRTEYGEGILKGGGACLPACCGLCFALLCLGETFVRYLEKKEVL